MWFTDYAVRAVIRQQEKNLEKSVLSRIEVQRALSLGAPPTPWPLLSADRDAIDLLARYFAAAIPVPTPEGKVRIVESVGYGGPQLAIYVPVLSEKTPVAVLTRNWHSSELESDLFFFGAPDGRLFSVVSKLGFVKRTDANEPGVSVFRNSHTNFRRAG